MGNFTDELGEHIRGIIGEIDPGPAEPDEEEDFDFDLTDEDRSKLSFTQTLRRAVWEFGGPTGIAKALRGVHQEAPKGSNTRARIVERLVQSIQDHGEDVEIEDEESVEAMDAELTNIYRQEFIESLPEPLRTQVSNHFES